MAADANKAIDAYRRFGEEPYRAGHPVKSELSAVVGLVDHPELFRVI
jgi:hypothetical protein